MDTKVSFPSRRGFLKGVAIGAGAYALGSSLIYPQLAFGQSIEGALGKMPMEARWELASGSLVSMYANYFKMLYDQRGKEKYVEFMKQWGQRVTGVSKGFVDRFGFIGNDAKAAAEIVPAFVALYLGPKQKSEIEEATAEKARVKCTNCAFWNTVQSMKISDDLCSPWSQYTWEGWTKGINPNLTVTLAKARPLGDSVCEWVFERKA